MSADAEKPRFRGVSHQAAFFSATGAGAVLVAVSPGSIATLSSAVYAASTAILFGASALYHRPRWSPGTRRLLRRIDHSAIYLLIAGTYTPLCLLALGAETGSPLLAVVWAAAAAGIGKSVLWPDSPKVLTAALYLVMGWAVAPYLPEVGAALGALELSLIAAGGILYTVGAGVYAMRAPDPFPRVFGYHEVFHALVVAASTCHFVAISRVVLHA